MAAAKGKDGMLSPYRALDLTDEMGLICGKILGDLGADVIKIEKPGGDATRGTGPFYHDEPDPENSLLWWAYNTSKRGVTLDIETAQGRDLFKKLVEDADFVIESFPPGYMDKLGLGYSELEKINPGVIMVSISPFGQTGPYRDFKTSDIVSFAMGGRMYATGEVDRPPVRMSHHSQSYLHAAADGAVGAMLALYHREMTGEGQQVDVSVQASVALILQSATFWDAVGFVPSREMLYPFVPPPPPGKRLSLVEMRKLADEGNVVIGALWLCKDGQVMWIFWTGEVAPRFNPPLFEWMKAEGEDVSFLDGLDWKTWDRVNDEEFTARIMEMTYHFFRARSTAELMRGAVKHHAMVGPVATTEDIVESDQLADRNYWVQLEHPGKGCVKYPGAFAIATETPIRPTRRAPLVGEHNQEVFGDILGLSEEDILELQQGGII